MEFKLHVLLEFNIIIQFLSVIIHCPFPTETDIFCPFCPLYIVKSSFHSHKQCIIWQPPAILIHEFLILRILTGLTSLISLSKQWIASFINLLVINGTLCFSPVYLLTFCTCQNPFLNQFIQTDKVRISCKCRKGLIWRISITGRSKRENLPITLACSFEPIYKFICAFWKTTDSILGR